MPHKILIKRIERFNLSTVMQLTDLADRFNVIIPP